MQCANQMTFLNCLPLYGECSGAYQLPVLLGAAIVVYFVWLSSLRNGVDADLLNVKVFHMPVFGENCCSWWPISHFCFFFVLGVLYPDCDVVVLALGVLWELFEMSWSFVEGSQRQAQRELDQFHNSNVEYSGNWWAGSFKDILFNTAGFYTGKATVRAVSGFGWNVCIPGLNANTVSCRQT